MNNKGSISFSSLQRGRSKGIKEGILCAFGIRAAGMRIKDEWGVCGAVEREAYGKSHVMEKSYGFLYPCP